MLVKALRKDYLKEKVEHKIFLLLIENLKSQRKCSKKETTKFSKKVCLDDYIQKYSANRFFFTETVIA